MTKAPHLFFPAGTAGDKTDPVAMNPARADWSYSGLRIMSLPADEVRTLSTGTTEMAMLPLSGGGTVEVENRKFLLAGRSGVFDAVTDFVYVPIDTEVRVSTNAPLEIALCTAEATRWIDPYYVPAGDVGVEVRGGGPGTRQINNFLSADAHDADRLIAVEVITPEGSWSSYPPHKHDEMSDDEVELEEIYYFRIDGPHGTGFFSCYTDDEIINETVTVRDGDLFLVPRGYHGPAAASPGHHMYYLNVMAGPSPERVWRFRDDPQHSWIREALERLPSDPRLPMTSAGQAPST